MKQKILFISLLLYSLIAVSQEHKKYDWNPQPTFIKQNEKDQLKDYYSIFEKHIVDYRRKQFLTGISYMYTTIHKLYQINNEKGLERNNTIYISMSGSISLASIKARVIKPNGIIKNFDKSNIKEVDNIKDKGNYKIFAIEGLEVNNQLELLYTLKKHHNNTGTILMQNTYDIKKSQILLRVPSNKNIDFKVYNTKYDTKKELKNFNHLYTVTAYNLEGIEKEKMSARVASMAKLYYNSNSNSYSSLWGTLANNFKVLLNTSKSKKIVKHFKKKHIIANNNYSKSVLLHKISDYINTFNYTKDEDLNTSNLKQIYRSKKVDKYGVIRLYSVLCKEFDIDLNIVISSNKYIHKFDTTFYSNINFEYLQLYFPNLERYLDISKFPIAPLLPVANTTDNEGIFINRNHYNFKKIQSPSYKTSMSTNLFDISLDLDNETTNVKNIKQHTGYPALYRRFSEKNVSVDKIDKYHEWSCNNSIKDIKVLNFEIEYKDLKYTYDNTPLIYKYEYSTEELLENLGDSYIFNIGSILGSQLELYQSTKRKLPVDVDYDHGYTYEIKFKIPEGYRIKNPENLTLNRKSLNEETITAQFISQYKIENKTLIINILENYSQTHYELDEYEGFKSAINGAYDFFKTSIILEPIK